MLTVIHLLLLTASKAWVWIGMSCHRRKQIPLTEGARSKKNDTWGVTADKDIWIVSISVVFSRSCQVGQIRALPGDFGRLSDFNYLETKQAIRANDKAWTQRIRVLLGELMHRKDAPHLTLQPDGLARMQLDETRGAPVWRRVCGLSPWGYQDRLRAEQHTFCLRQCAPSETKL